MASPPAAAQALSRRPDRTRTIVRELSGRCPRTPPSRADEADIEIHARVAAAEFRIELRDRGGGMSAAVLENALLPFYSTKRSGTGLGLALTREIVEAHGGRVALANRDGGGLVVSLFLPLGSD